MPNKAFPVGNPLGILKWRFVADDEALVPLAGTILNLLLVTVLCLPLSLSLSLSLSLVYSYLLAYTCRRWLNDSYYAI